MNNVKKDIAFLYMLRNFVGVFLVVLFAFILSLMQYYDCELVEALRRIFVNDIFTLTYFLIMWVFDYLLFEVSKIICDMKKELISYQYIGIMAAVSLVALFLPIADIMRYNLCFLLVLVTIRMVKQLIKKTGKGLKLKKQENE